MIIALLFGIVSFRGGGGWKNPPTSERETGTFHQLWNWKKYRKMRLSKSLMCCWFRKSYQIFDSILISVTHLLFPFPMNQLPFLKKSNKVSEYGFFESLVSKIWSISNLLNLSNVHNWPNLEGSRYGSTGFWDHNFRKSNQVSNAVSFRVRKSKWDLFYTDLTLKSESSIDAGVLGSLISNITLDFWLGLDWVPDSEHHFRFLIWPLFKHT